MTRTLRLATRKSPLALYQAELVADRLRAVHSDLKVTLVGVRSAGDIDVDRPIREFAGRGAFTTAVDSMVADNRAEASVHSAKDLPASEVDDGLVLVCVPDRADPRDVLVGSTLGELAVGATVATGSVRRRVQLAHLRPDLGFIDLRGNIATRLQKLPVDGAVLIARAALDRLNIDLDRYEVLSPSVMLPQVGQGAIALRCRSDDDVTIDLLAAINDVNALQSVLAERAFLSRLGGGCDAPVGAYATSHDGTISITAMIASSDGHAIARTTRTGSDPQEVGAGVAELLLLRHGADQLIGDLAGR